MASGFQTIGLNQVIASLASETVEARVRARAVVQDYSARIKATAKAFAPVETGELQASITYETHEDAGGAVGIIGAGTKQAIFMEYGTYKDPPQAFMGPALDRHSGDFVAAISRVTGL